jgi:archaellum component FlaG (FlaF/FlaG flagellin family)
VISEVGIVMVSLVVGGCKMPVLGDGVVTIVVRVASTPERSAKLAARVEKVFMVINGPVCN